MSPLSVLAKLLDEVRNLQKSWTLQKFTSFTQLPFLEYWKWSSAQAWRVLGARWLWMRAILEKGIICRGLHHQEMHKCSYNLSKMKAFLLLRPQFPQWRGATVTPHLDTVCMAELGLMFTQEYRNPELRHSSHATMKSCSLTLPWIFLKWHFILLCFQYFCSVTLRNVGRT